MTNEEKLNSEQKNDENNQKELPPENAEILEIDEEADKVEEIIKLKEQIVALEDKSLRALAEAENVRIRCNKQIDEARTYAVFNFAKDLIAVMDNLSRAIEYAPKEENEQLSGVIDGVIMTRNELESVFNKNGLQSIKPSPGEKFDYNLHSAISQIVTDEYDQDNIVNIMQVGYKIKDRLLRPAVVTVAKKQDNQESN